MSFPVVKPDGISDKVGISSAMLNLKYYFQKTPDFSFYLLGGINLSSWEIQNKFDLENPHGDVGWQTFMGVNYHSFIFDVGYILLNGVDKEWLITRDNLGNVTGYKDLLLTSQGLMVRTGYAVDF
jgi:hypothetical protein